MVESGFAAASPRRLLTVSGDRDDDRPLEAFLPEPPRDLVTFHAGQADVQQDDVRQVGLRLLDRGGSVVGHQGFSEANSLLFVAASYHSRLTRSRSSR